MRFCRRLAAFGFHPLVAVVALALVIGSGLSSATAKPSFKVAWSIYVGWMPWPYADEDGILKKWADKYGIEIKLIQGDYLATIEQFVAGEVDACAMTNMEALDMPAASGVDSTALIIGDFSNGNDGILLRHGAKVVDLKGKTVQLVELSVSHYLLARALEMNGLAEKDIKIVNTSDSDIAPTFLTNESVESIVTWNPQLIQARQAKGATLVFDSSSIPGEIIDMMVVNTKKLKEHPELGKALTGAWYEAMSTMSGRGAAGTKATAAMAEKAGSTVAELKQQLKTTAMFYKAADAADFFKGAKIKETMEYVRQFCFGHGLLGEGVTSVDAVGIELPDGNVLGDKGKVRLRFDSSFTEMAARGEL
ncbi:MAG: ABC transporter substrate-binding protein [Candidatus Schekmanbacteria bacterium]|nr:ABC transporter substrate-binding protein [Candidatus Schekmanbacteria bacterium]